MNAYQPALGPAIAILFVLFVIPCRAAPTLIAVGADSMDGLMKCWTEQLRTRDPKFALDFTAALSADGAMAMLDDNAHIAPFAREFFPAEQTAFEFEFGRIPDLVPVAVGSFASDGKTHAIAIYVNSENPVTGLSVAQLARIYSAPEPLMWREFGVEGPFGDETVLPAGMINRRESGNPPGIVNYLELRLGNRASFSQRVAQQVSTSEKHALTRIVEFVGNHEAAIGYSGFQFAVGQTRTVPIAASNDQYVSGTTATVATMSYPLARLIYLAIRPNLSTDFAERASAFIRFVQSDAGQECVQQDPDFLPLPTHFRRGLGDLTNFSQVEIR